MIIYIFSFLFFIVPVDTLAMFAPDFELGQIKHDKVTQAFAREGYNITTYNVALDKLATEKLKSLQKKGKPADEAYQRMKQGYKLLDNGCLDIVNLNGQATCSLHQSLHDNKPDLLDALLKSGANIEKRALSGKTPLMFVMECQLNQDQKLAFVKTLVEAGADINARSTHSGKTPLYYATQANLLSIMHYLLEDKDDPKIKKANPKADPDIGDVNCITPLMIAAQRDFLEAAQLLQRYKASLSLASDSVSFHKFWTAYDYAKKVENSRVAPWLKAEMKKAGIKYKY